MLKPCWSKIAPADMTSIQTIMEMEIWYSAMKDVVITMHNAANSYSLTI